MFMLLDANVAADVAQKTDEARKFLSAENLNSLFMNFINWAGSMLINIIISIIVWKIGKYAIKWVQKIVNKTMEKANIDQGVIKFIDSIVRFGIYAILVILILEILGFQTASLIAVLGSAALALSLSLQGSLSNFAGGILIMLFKPFKTGDYIVVGNCEGTVESIEILYTKLKTVDNRQIMMPNGTLSNSNIVNVGANGDRRLDIQIGIGYGSDVSKAKNILRQIITEYPTVDKDKEIMVIVKSLDDSCVTLETRAWVKQDTYWDTRFIFLEKFKQEFDKNGIEIPFNQLDVHMRQD